MSCMSRMCRVSCVCRVCHASGNSDLSGGSCRLPSPAFASKTLLYKRIAQGNNGYEFMMAFVSERP
jgi:hypothetical protein